MMRETYHLITKFVTRKESKKRMRIFIGLEPLCVKHEHCSLLVFEGAHNRELEPF